MSLKRPEVDDETLMARFQRGDRAALDELVRRHQDGLFGFAKTMARSASSAEDVVQEAFVRVVVKASEFKHESRFTTWLYAITRNLCVDHIRKSTLRNHPSLDEARPEGDGGGAGSTLGERTADPRASVERDAVGMELKVRIAAAVEGLPDEQREVFWMREMAGLPFKDIAELTGVAENTVKSRMRYALERLQAVLHEYEEFARTLGG